MKLEQLNGAGPRGGLRAGLGTIRPWRWNGDASGLSAPVAYRREQWYLVRGRVLDDAPGRATPLRVRFRSGDTTREQALELSPLAARPRELLGWLQSPADAGHVQIGLPDIDGPQLAELVFHPVAERDTKCHPLANVPRWSACRPSLRLEGVLLPPALEHLTPVLDGAAVEIFQPQRKSELAGAVRNKAVVLDPAWVSRLGLRWGDLERLAAESWVLLDLASTARLLSRDLGLAIRSAMHRSDHGIMSARVAYSDVPTRGFALLDVFPFGVLRDDGGFSSHVLLANRAWKRFADERGFAALLATESPDPKECRDLLTAALPVGQGELIATDVPWLAGGAFGPPLAPRLLQHLLRAHLGLPIDDALQYWNRWDDVTIVLRDIADLARRYPPLQTVRWAGAADDAVRLGVALPAETPRRTLVLSTGRIDRLASHGGLPPEPLTIFMKMLSREKAEQTPWARRHLADQTVIWQFDSLVGQRHASSYAAASPWLHPPLRQVALGTDASAIGPPAAAAPGAPAQTFGSASSSATADAAAPPADGPAGRLVIPLEEGVFGDGAFEFQARLDRDLRRIIAAT